MKKNIPTTKTAAALAIAAIGLFAPSALAEEAKNEKAPLSQTLITNVQVWDGLADKAVAADVLIEGDKIKTVGKGLKADKATVIDGKGGYLIPGIIDSHQHIMLSKGTGPDDIIIKGGKVYKDELD